MTSNGLRARTQAEVLDLLEFRVPQEPAFEHPAIGDEIDGFILQRELGRGGSAIVFEATQALMQRRVALKILPCPPGLDTVSRRARFSREIEALAAVSHPSVVEIYAAGHRASFHYIAMQLIHGATLAQLIAGTAGESFPRPGRAGWTELVQRILRQIADGLAAAHAAGILHRDVKPANILVTEAGEACLVDFGLARQEHGDVTWTEGFVGTRRFASPEQLAGETLCPASDVFSLGSTAFAAFCGTPPFVGTTKRDTAHKIRYDEVRWPSRVSNDLRAVIDRCLEKQPRARYATAAEVRDEFDRMARLEPVRAKPIGRLGRALRYARRRPARVAVAATLTITLLLTVLATTLATRRGNKLRRLELRTQVDAALANVRNGRLQDARSKLATFVQRNKGTDGSRPDEVVAAAAGLLGDLCLDEGDAAAGRSAYALALRTPHATRADFAGAEAALALHDSRLPRIATDWPPASSARDFDLEARLLAMRHEIERAIAMHDRAVALQPGNFLWRRHRSLTLIGALQRTRAMDDLRALRIQRPDDTTILEQLAYLLESRDPKQAERLVRMALQFAPGHIRLTVRLARAIGAQGNHAREVEILHGLFDKHPRDPYVQALYARGLCGVQRSGDARPIVSAGLRAYPKDVNLHWAAAEVARRQRNAAELERHVPFLLASPSRQQRAVGLWYRAQAHGLRSKPLERLADLRRAAKLDPESAYYGGALASALLEFHRTAEARSELARALRINGRSARLHRLNGRAAMVAGDTTEAIQELLIAHSLNKNSAITCSLLSRAWGDLAQPKRALVWARKATALAPKSINAGIALADALLLNGALKQAVLAYQTTLARHPAPGLRADYAEALHKLGRERDAIREYQRARSDDDRLATTYCGEALIRLESKDPAIRDPAAAVELMRRALALDPKSNEYRAYLKQATLAARTGRK